MKMIVGLGNPGSQYENTRHNMGWGALDAVARRAGIRVIVNRDRALTGLGYWEGERILLVKPLTYMNLSGEAAGPLARYYKIAPEDVLVLCDDVYLPLGQLRIRKSGSAGGHNGLKSLIAHLGSDRFPRIRCGVGPLPEQGDMVDFVLRRFAPSELEAVRAEYDLAAEAALCFLSRGAEAAMNRYNQKPAKPKKERAPASLPAPAPSETQTLSPAPSEAQTNSPAPVETPGAVPAGAGAAEPASAASADRGTAPLSAEDR